MRLLEDASIFKTLMVLDLEYGDERSECVMEKTV
jgi:hypothetical protein